jgi:hypothetical protein
LWRISSEADLIQALDVDRAEPWPDGPDRQEDEAASDLTDEEWERMAPLMPKPGRRGRPREVDFREVINAVRYLVRSGCGWRMLPIHFGSRHSRPNTIPGTKTAIA